MSAAMLRRLAAPLFGLALLCAAPAARAADGFDFTGDWKGEIVFDKPTTYGPAKASYALSIHDGYVLIDVTDADGKDFEFCHDACTFMQRGANAVIAGINRGEPGDNGVYWIESWTLSATLTDPDHLLIEFTRLVRNVGLTKPDKGFSPEFGMRGEGSFVRDAAPAEPIKPALSPPPAKLGDT